MYSSYYKSASEVSGGESTLIIADSPEFSILTDLHETLDRGYESIHICVYLARYRYARYSVSQSRTPSANGG